ncbi:unnamed protein product [Leuciscus chuanchicus]
MVLDMCWGTPRRSSGRGQPAASPPFPAPPPSWLSTAGSSPRRTGATPPLPLGQQPPLLNPGARQQALCLTCCSIAPAPPPQVAIGGRHSFAAKPPQHRDHPQQRGLTDSASLLPPGFQHQCNTEELNTALKSLKKKLKRNEKIKAEFEKTVQYIKSQAEHTERQIKQQFEKLHQFLRDEEEATVTALREEEEQKKQMMKEKLEEMNTHISALSHTIKDMEEMMKANDFCFLKEFPVSMERVQSSQPDPQMASGALIHVPRYLGNLPFRVWKKMQDIVQNSESDSRRSELES